MGGDSLGLARSLEHEQLGQDGDGFEEDGEGPEDLGDVEFVVEDEAEDDAGPEEVLDFEGVDCGVVGWSLGTELVSCSAIRTSVKPDLNLNFMR